MPAGMNLAARDLGCTPIQSVAVHHTRRPITRCVPSCSASRRAAELNSAVFRIPVMRSRWSSLQFGCADPFIMRRNSSRVAVGHTSFSRLTEPGHPTGCERCLPSRHAGGMNLAARAPTRCRHGPREPLLLKSCVPPWRRNSHAGGFSLHSLLPAGCVRSDCCCKIELQQPGLFR